MKRLICSAAAAALMLGGCSVTSQEEVFRSLDRTLKRDLVWIKTPEEAQKVSQSVDALISTPLSPENAVRIALINNRSLQQTYEEIGIAHAELVQAGLMSNPVLGYSVGRGGGVTAKTVSLELAFLDLLWIPLRRELGGMALEEAKLRVGNEVLQTVRETTAAFVEARAAEEIVLLHDELLKSYETSVQLAIRQQSAGNLSKRDVLKIREQYARARVEAMDVRTRAAEAREELNKMMGVYGASTRYTFKKGEQGLALPPSSSEGLERAAIASRLDVSAAKKRLEYAAREAGITESTRFLDELTLEAESEKSTGETRFNTYGVKIPLPVFDIGQGRVGTAQARYNESHHALYALSVAVRSDVRRSYASLRYSYNRAQEYRENIVKLNQEILEQTGLYYNGMLEGIYELLEDQRRLAEAKIESVEATAEYEKALADMAYATGIPTGEISNETK